MKKSYFILKRDGTKELVKEATPVELIDGVEMFIYCDKKFGTWTLMEVRTGMCLAYGPTRKKCMEMFDHRIKKVGIDEFKNLIKIGVAKNGEMPRV